MTDRMIPQTQDRDTAGYFAAAAEGRLVVRACADCGRASHPPTAHCRFCGSWNTGWRSSEGHGTLYSWITVEHGAHPAYPVPYTVVLVSVDDAPGVRLVGQIAGTPDLHEGQAMHVWFDRVADGATIPQWRPAPPTGSA